MTYFNSIFFKILFAFCFCIAISLNAGNPLIKNIGMSDPHVRVFNDTIYLYTGNDESPTDRLWVMRDWRVYKSTDMINWTLESIISPTDNYMDNNSKDCWAGDAATRNGKYYFYFSDHKRGIGVMQANTPGGRYTDALGGPLVAPMHDPTLFVDDDANQTPYIVYGDKAGGGFRIAKLNDDMISLAETTKPIIINGQLWLDAPKWQDKNYLFKHNGTYYLSWGRDYATAKNVYGPYECIGAVGTGFNLNAFAHGSFFWWKGQFYHIWTYYLDMAFKYRECIISYCHFNDNGEIVTDTHFLSQHFATGMGQYDAAWPKIEAEWYYEKSPNITKQQCAEGGFELSNIQNNSWVRFANVDMHSAPTQFSARVGNTGGSGSIQIRLDSLNGILLGEAFYSTTHASKAYSTITTNLLASSGKRDVYLLFKSNASTVFNLNNFSFAHWGQTSAPTISQHSIQLYPNPSTTGIFHLPQALCWTVLSNTGHKIATGQGTVVDLSQHPTGMYHLLTNNTRTKILRI